MSCQYADDMINVTTDAKLVNKWKKDLPTQLLKYQLGVNESKTEEYEIYAKGPESWRKCKVLGSLLDTTDDKKTRNGLAISYYIKNQTIYKSNNISHKTKLKCIN